MRSTLPFAVSGIDSSFTYAAGTMYSGSADCAWARSASGVRSLAAAVVGDQALVAALLLPRHHHRLRHPRHRRQTRLDLSGLHPESADLHLTVVATQELDCPVRLPPAQVPRTVHLAGAVHLERIVHEPLGRQLRTIQVSQRHTVAPDVDLPRHPHRSRLAASIEHVHLRVADRPAQRNARRVGSQRPDLVRQRERRRLRRTVPVEQVRRRVAPKNPSDHPHVQRVPPTSR